MGNPLGVHFTPTHQGQHHYDFIREMQPDLLKIVGSGQVGTPDVQIMADCYNLAPNATHIYRNQPLSEQHDFLWRDPAGAAVEHVATMARELDVRVQEARQRGLELPPREQWRILGINEPVIELFPRNEDMSNYTEWLAMAEHRSALLDTYMDVFMLESDKYDLRSFVGNFSGGQPANRKPGEYATYSWFPKTRKRIEASNKRHALAVHEYWDVPGPEEMENWWTWRWKHCEWDCDIAVLESGVDRRIRGATYEGNRGWIGHMEAPAYVDQHRRYMLPCLEDGRFIGATPFTLDGNKDWWSFFIEGCMKEMVALANELRGMSPSIPDSQPVTIRLPQINNGTRPVEEWDENWFDEPREGAVTVSQLNVRGGPGTDYPIVGSRRLGDRIEAHVEVKRGAHNWLAIGENDWVASDYITWDGDIPAEPTTPDEMWEQAWPIVLKIEGGLSLDPNDTGNWYQGKLVGTKYGISAKTWGHLYDIPNLTKEQALAIYKQSYWDASGAGQLSWPMSLIHFDTAINHGVTTANTLRDYKPTPEEIYLGQRGLRYFGDPKWRNYGVAWGARVNHLHEIEKESR